MRSKIREIREADIWLLHKWINDPEVIQYTYNYRPISEMEQKEWFNNTSYFRNNYVFGIELIADNKLIGTCGLYDPDFVAHKAELKMKIADKGFRGQGLGSEALKQLLAFGFDDLNLNKIWLRVLSDNQPAVNLYKKAGFQYEGLLRNDMFIKGNFHDVILMSLLKEEYERT
ncbi:Spermidine N(1)-acetyltransferase [anaerobic digester metagenome]